MKLIMIFLIATFLVVAFSRAYSQEARLKDIVRKADRAEFEAYRMLPVMQTKDLEKYIDPAGPAYGKIHNVLVKEKEKGWILTNEGNPSRYKIISMRVKKIEKERAIIMTREYWEIRWYDPRQKKYVYNYHEENDQTWVLVRRPKGEWRVWSTDYPKPQNSTKP